MNENIRFNQIGPKFQNNEENITLTFQKEQTSQSPLSSEIFVGPKNCEIKNNDIQSLQILAQKNITSIKKLPIASKWNVLLLTRKWIYQMKNLIFHKLHKKDLKKHDYEIFQEEFPEEIINKKITHFSLILSSFQKFAFSLKKNLKKIPIISPDNKLKFLWDFLIMILTLCHFFFIVYSLAFYEDEKFHSFYDKWLNFLIYTIPFDVLLKLNSGFFANGTPVEERRLIIKKYFQNDFFWDTLTFFVLLIQIIFEYKHKDNYNFYMHLLQIFYFSKYQIFEKIIQNVEEIISFDEKIEAFISLIKLFFKLLFFAHLVACIWYALGKSSELNQTTWLENFSGKSETFKYLVSLYWAITTISTIGYGDITPCNEKEYLFSLIVMILGSMFFGYSLTYMGGIFDQLQKEEVLKRENLILLNKYMKNNNIDFNTQIQIRKYMNFLWENGDKQIYKNDHELFSKLSENLKYLFLSQATGKYISSLPLFSKNFSKEFLKEIIFIMKPVTFDPNAIIYEKGNNGNYGIFILSEGEVSTTFPKKMGELNIQTFKKGESFGEREFFTKQEREFTVKSLTYSKAYVIYLDEFLLILKNYEEDFEQYNLIKDKLILSNESNYFYKPCFSCQKNSHEISKCPTLNPVLNKSLIIKKYNIPISQNREFVYRKRKKLNTRALKLLIQTTQKIFSLNSDQEDKKIFSINKIMTESMEFEEKENLPDNELESPYLNKSSITKVKSAPIKTRPTDKISVSNNKKPEENLQKINSEEKIKINSSEEINNLKNSINDSKNTKSEDNYLNENFSYINSIKPSKKKSSKEDFFNEIHDFERMKFFAKYQPNFNFDVIIMLANKEYYYRLKKNGSKKKKYRKKKRSNYEYNQRGMFKATFSLFKNRPNSKMKFLQTPELASIDNIEN